MRMLPKLPWVALALAAVAGPVFAQDAAAPETTEAVAEVVSAIRLMVVMLRLAMYWATVPPPPASILPISPICHTTPASSITRRT